MSTKARISGLSTLGARAARPLLPGVAPRDALSILGATALLILVAALASYVPARRAAGVDPGVTFRAEEVIDGGAFFLAWGFAPRPVERPQNVA